MDDIATQHRLPGTPSAGQGPTVSRLLRRLLGISSAEIGFERRGFRGGTPAAREHIESIGAAFLYGYHAALEERTTALLVRRLESCDAELRGFHYEGAAMALHLLDRLLWRRRSRFAEFICDAGNNHIYMAYVGAGWAQARLPFGLASSTAQFDPLLRWLALDGYGFHQGFFRWPTFVAGSQRIPSRLRGYARRAFDQGLGRSLWFVDGHDAELIAITISRFAPARHSDLWAGIGLAATYAGGASVDALINLRDAAGAHHRWLAQGAAFAAAARARAGNLVTHTDHGCKVFCGLSALQAAAVVDEASRDLPQDHPATPAYEAWRQRIGDRIGQAIDERTGRRIGPEIESGIGAARDSRPHEHATDTARLRAGQEKIHGTMRISH
jgi:hypothetical protein